MSFFDPQNPGIGGFDELTEAEEVFLTTFAGLSFANGDILYYDDGQLKRLPKGSNGQVLILATGLPSWSSSISVQQIFNADNAIAASGNAATVTRAYRNNVVTNNSAATLTITMSTTDATGGDMVLVQIIDASAVAQTITWVNTENSTVTAPTTSNGSTTLPLTVGFKWNPLTSKWRCVAKA